MKVRIHGIADGLYKIEEEMPVSKLAEMMPEFFGNIRFEGDLRVLGKRYTIIGKAQCTALLVCDISLEEYEELIETEIIIAFIADTVLFNLNNDNLPSSDGERVIHKDDEYFDLTDDIVEQLSVELPMKRVSPKYRDKSFGDIYPEFASKSTESEAAPETEDNRWAALKNVKLN